MKKLVFLALLPLLLGACTPNGGSNQGTENGSQGQTTETGGHSKPSNHNTSTETDTEKDDETGGNQEEHNQQQDDENEKYPLDNDDYRPTNEPLSLDSKTTFAFSDEYGPLYPDGWTFYHGDSKNPNGGLWQNPTKIEFSGIDFDDKNMFLVSPNIKSYKKVEIDFYIWFNHHTSDKYKATKNEPTFKVKAFDNESNLLSTTDVNYVRSNVPSTKTTYNNNFYIREPNMSYFIIKFNNFIDNGNSGYSPVITKITLKGWDYD